LWTNFPNLALDWTIAKGTPIALQRVGKKTTVSIGSTSEAIKTNFALFCSTR
jgi:hypothetical protein